MTEPPPSGYRPWTTTKAAEFLAEEIAELGPDVNANNADERYRYVQTAALVALLTETLALHRTMARLLHLAETARTTTQPPQQQRSGW